MVLSQKYYFFGINSKKVMTFWEWIPKKLYICSVKTFGYDWKIPV